ncbi:MAG: 3-isopropylmalate dehydratase small subunit [Firmicutes bacterium]|nr:3-isopropylmalate dehydratase small subunit [Bacillota bacterium]
MEVYRGKVLSKFGSHISTDDMTSAKYITSHEPAEVAKICMRDIDPDFPKKMAPGGVLIAEKNFGCGSSRETAAIAVKAAGTQVVIAEEFARIFYRNSFNIGMPCIECPGIHAATDLGDELEIDYAAGTIKNLTKGTEFHFVPIPEALFHQLEVGGLVPLIKDRLKERNNK